ncbi:hypothetical protein BDN72DRAFT_858244 [Pluteus cervinus]|uniref:Uncharacterized protein n=1 Tax=Pluteus cervinus TaxID=181527 RepID=A0ACD3ASL9_9AGAR|nr:hypothetical protein BDN72DRAFT_858244 [Pluteus cervinus]
MLSFQQQNAASNVAQAMQVQPQLPQQDSQNQLSQQPSTLQAMRLRDNPPAITPPAPRPSRKRKTPPNNESSQPPPPQAGPQPIPHVLPPPHAMMHSLPGPLPPYPYPPADYTPAGLPPHPGPLPEGQPGQSPSQSPNGGRALSMTKRAEQNRKAQRAFRERRDQHVKALESRSQLLDAALASADEANRRWEECRALVDQLRVENAALRAALSQAQMLPPGTGPTLSSQHPDDGDRGQICSRLPAWSSFVRAITMAESLRSWILDYLTLTAQKYGEGLYRVPWESKGKTVQVIEFLTDRVDGLIWCSVSDKDVSVPVRFSKEAMAQYHTDHEKPFSRRGNLLVVIKEFRVFFSRIPSGQNDGMTADPHLAIECKSVSVIGGEHEAGFGRLEDVETKENLRSWLSALNSSSGHRPEGKTWTEAAEGQHPQLQAGCTGSRRRYDSCWAPIVADLDLFRPKIGLPALLKTLNAEPAASASEGTPCGSSPERPLSLDWPSSRPASPADEDALRKKLGGFCFEEDKLAVDELGRAWEEFATAASTVVNWICDDENFFVSLVVEAAHDRPQDHRVLSSYRPDRPTQRAPCPSAARITQQHAQPCLDPIQSSTQTDCCPLNFSFSFCQQLLPGLFARSCFGLMSSPSIVSGAITSLSGKADLNTIFCLVVFCIVVLVLAYLTNPTESSFRAYLTEQSFRQHLTRLEGSYDDESNVHDHRNTLPLSAKGSTQPSPFTSSSPFHFSNRASISLRTPKHIFHTFGIFTVAIVVPVSRFPSVTGQSSPAIDSWYIGALGRWCRVGPFDAWYQDAFLKVKDEEGWSSGILQIKNLDTLAALPLARKSTQHPPQVPRGIHPKLKIRDRSSQLMSTSLRPSLHKPDMLPLHNPVAALKLPQPQTSPPEQVAFNDRSSSRRVSSFYDQTPVIAKVLSEMNNSRASTLDIRTQLVDFQVSATQSRDILQCELDACRDRKRQEDASKADTKSRTKLLDDARRNAESVRREAEKRLKTVQQEHTRSHTRWDHLDKEILYLRDQVQADKLRIAESTGQHSELECEVTTQLEHTRLEIKSTEDALLSLNAQARSLEERLAVKREKLRLVKERVASRTESRESTSHGNQAGGNITFNQHQTSPLESEIQDQTGLHVLPGSCLSLLNSGPVASHPSVCGNIDGQNPPVTPPTANLCSVLAVDQAVLPHEEWQNLASTTTPSQHPEPATSHTYDPFIYEESGCPESWPSQEGVSRPPWVQCTPLAINSLPGLAHEEEGNVDNSPNPAWGLNPDPRIFNLPIPASDPLESNLYEVTTPATGSSLLRAFAPSPAERQALQRAFGGSKNSSLDRLPSLIDVDVPRSVVHAQVHNEGRSKVLPTWLQSIPLPIYRASKFCPWDDEDTKERIDAISDQTIARIDLPANQP